MSRRHSFAWSAACAVLLSFPVLAQQTALEREVEFVRKLATRLRFIELAQSETARLQKAYTNSDDFKRVSQLDIEISLIGARAHPNREERRTLFQEGLEKSAEFIDRYSNDPVADDARVTMVQACVRFGEFLNEEIEVAREESPDKVAELEERAAEIYRRGVEVCDKFLQNNATKATASNPGLQQKYYFCWLNKAILQRENARAVKRDREPLASLSRETFEELILEIGEESLLGLRGYFEMSRIGEVLADYETAVQDYEDTIESITISLDSEELVLSAWLEAQLIDLMQEAYAALMQTLLNDGQTDRVLEMGQAFRVHLVEFAGGGDADSDPFEMATDFGHSAFLTEARALAESGEGDKVATALAQIRKINDEHPDDILGIRAKLVLSQVLELNAGDSSVVTGSMLFEVAKGDYQSRNYEAAIRGFKRAFFTMTEAEKRSHGLNVWNLTGRCFGQQKRYAEATMAFARALEGFGATTDDPTEPVADSLDRAWGAYRRSTLRDDDRAMSGLQTKVNSLIVRFGGKDSASKNYWKNGTAALNDQNYPEAAALYSKVTPDSPYYEPARARIALSLREQKKFDEARKAIVDYRAWIETAQAQIAPNDRTGAQGRRDQALAAIAYYELAMAFEECNPKNGTKDPTKFQGLLSYIGNYLDTHSTTGQSYLERCYDMRAQLHAELGQLDKAEESYRKLKSDFAGSAYIASLATRIFVAHRERVRAHETEYESQIKADAKASVVNRTFDKLQDARRSALSIALDYASTSAKPSYSMLSNGLNLAEQIKDWGTVEKLGRQMRDTFANSSKEQKKVAKFIVPAIGEALLRQKKFRDAETALREAIESNPKDYRSKRLLALTLGGWIELDERLSQIEELGLDKPVEAYQLIFVEYGKFVKAKYEDYSIDWYRFMWECYLIAKRAAVKDSTYLRRAKTLYRNADGQEAFATLRTLGVEGQRLFQLFTSNPP